MLGTYVNGCNQAHKWCKQHESVFGQTMYGTFNIQLKTGNIFDYEPTIIYGNGLARYWLVKIQKDSLIKYGFAIRGSTSKLPVNLIEVTSHVLLPNEFKFGTLEVNFL